jgi:hypothetical protein
MRFVLSIFVIMALCGCKSETKVEKAPEPATAPEEKPIITEKTKAADADVKKEVEIICMTLKACFAAEKEGRKCDAKGVLKAMDLKSPYGSGLRDRLVSSDLGKKSLTELTQNARGLGARCEL